MIIKPKVKTALIIFLHHNSLPVLKLHEHKTTGWYTVGNFFASKGIFTIGFIGDSPPTKAQGERK